MKFPGGPPAVVTLAALGAVAVYAVYFFLSMPGTVTTPVPSSFTVGGRSYAFTYVAVTQTQREAGLMNRQITNTTTMLFAFPYPSEWGFWMLDTNTSLDIMWVNATGSTGQVVYLVSGATPCYAAYSCTVYTPTSAVTLVIEARSGFAKSNGISVGTLITLG